MLNTSNPNLGSLTARALRKMVIHHQLLGATCDVLSRNAPPEDMGPARAVMNELPDEVRTWVERSATREGYATLSDVPTPRALVRVLARTHDLVEHWASREHPF